MMLLNPRTKPRLETKENSNQFDWPIALDAEKFLRERVDNYCEGNRFARDLRDRMRQETGTDFFEWIDHLTLEAKDEAPLRGFGFVPSPAVMRGGETVLYHPRALFPRIILRSDVHPEAAELALRLESVSDFIAAHSLKAEIEGQPFSRFRRAVVNSENGVQLQVIERNAYRGFVPASLRTFELKNLIDAQELWHTRRRYGLSDEEGFVVANDLLTQVIDLAGGDLACDLFFKEERHYWQTRNRAARIQKNRQDRLGLGWANHDHHTFRSSRQHFGDLIRFLLRLGFQKRERFHAGEGAGWGAQICEHPTAGIVVFCDVDLLPEEASVDFSAVPLPPTQSLGTIGLWVGLHGESFLEAGLHHLEARFEFDALRSQLEKWGISSMKPFSDFEFLRQAFTEGERWPVRPERAQKLLDQKRITQDQFNTFLSEGAIGSHLENLQRHGGYKGFNRNSASAIIAATDPRRPENRLTGSLDPLL